MISLMDKPFSDDETFNVLIPIVREWFQKKFKTFSPPQKYSIMNIHNRRNTLISSPTGSGKTLSAFTAILNELIRLSGKEELENRVYCIYISPLKALANDIEKNLKEPLKEINALADSKIKNASKNINIRVAIRTGDTTSSEKSSMLLKTPHILITTPESFAITLASVKFKEKLKDAEWIIVDEIHSLASSKRGAQLSLCLERLEYFMAINNKTLTRIGLSATVSPLDKVAQFLVGIQNPAIEEPRDCSIIDVQDIKRLDLKVLSPVPDLIGSDYTKTYDQLYNLIDSLIQDHKTTLIFTNTRSATERVVHHLKERFPQNYIKLNDDGDIKSIKDIKDADELREIASRSYIGAHHGSLSKEHRLNIENRLKEGKLRAVVSSTSLELGIDIGYIDLVILLGSPKGVARALQRIGRSGHKLHDISKGRIIVLDRDDLVECSVLLKAAIERKIDNISIPENCLDVLAQEVFGMAIEEQRHIDIVYDLVRKSYSFRNLKKSDFIEVIRYLNGQYASLEDRNVYAKIWFDEESGMIGKRGKLARVLYMTNIGTIPDESFVRVKLQGSGDSEKQGYIGKIDENFLERLKRNDVFVLGGNTYEFLYSQGMTAFVKSSINRPPTVPSWASETLPLSFELALEIQKFRRYIEEFFINKSSKDEILGFIHKYLYVDEYGANAIYEYMSEQYHFSRIAHDKKIVIEHFSDETNKFIVFHTLYGRRVNDVLSRAMAYVISRLQHRDVEINVNDNGFYILTSNNIQAAKAFKLIKSTDLRRISELSLDKTEVLGRRFRHCASRAMMILRSYMGKRKSVSRQQLSSRLLISSVRRIGENFPILKEAKREVLEDLMDIKNAEIIFSQIESGRISIEEIDTAMPSPFAFNLITMGYGDIMKMEDKILFLKRMHDMVRAKISLDKGKHNNTNTNKDLNRDSNENNAGLVKEYNFDYDSFWSDQESEQERERNEMLEHLKLLVWELKDIPLLLKEHIIDVLSGSKDIRPDLIEAIKLFKDDIRESWPEELRIALIKRLVELGELSKEFLE